MAAHRRTALVVAALPVAVALAACSGDDRSADADNAPGTVVCKEKQLGGAADTPDPAARITHYDSDLTISAKGGGLTGHETITADFDDHQHRGIYRDFDDDDFIVTDVSGKVDGKPAGLASPGPSGRRLTLGQPDATLTPGEHVFDIDYVADAVLEPGTEVEQDWQFAATVIGPGWAMDIADAEVQIHLPAGSSGDVSCAIGPGASAHVEGAGTSNLVLVADDVPAGTGVRVVAGVDKDVYPGE